MDILQVVHVAQLYQTITVAAIGFLFMVQILVFKNQIWSHYTLIRFKQHQNQSLWFNHLEQQSLQNTNIYQTGTDNVRKQLTNQVQNTNMENQNQQTPQQFVQQPQPQIKQVNPPPSTPQVQINPPQLTQLNQHQKSVLLFYIQYNNFISNNVSIILSLLVIGILTFSTRIYSLASFFLVIFGDLIVDFLQFQATIKAQQRRGLMVQKIVKVLSSCFILGIFITYWIYPQFSLSPY